MKHAISCVLMAIFLCSCSTLRQKTKVETSPHAEAIRLVMSTQQYEIRKVDAGNWWHDVKTREWKAKRPFYPGIFDSTHTFIVTYRINGNRAQSWLVDTRKGTVQIEKASTAENE